MNVTDADLQALGKIITPAGRGLRVDSSVQPPRLTNGCYIVNKQQKWVMSIYRNVKVLENDIEIAIDVHALVWPDESGTYSRARAWLALQREELEHLPSGKHATQPPDAERIGLKLENARIFLNRLLHQLLQQMPSQRWLKLADQPLEVPSEADVPPSPPSHPAIDCIDYMMRMAKNACAQSGKESVTIAKSKEWGFDSDEAFRACVNQLMLTGRCALSELELDLTMADGDLAPSLDRIDSNGHYQPDNLQVVARFVNRWKSDDLDQNFRRLLGLLRSSVLSSASDLEQVRVMPPVPVSRPAPAPSPSA